MYNHFEFITEFIRNFIQSPDSSWICPGALNVIPSTWTLPLL